MRKQDTLPENWPLGLLVAGIVAGLVLFITSWLLWQIPYPAGLNHYQDNLRHWLALRLHGLLPFLGDMANTYQAYLMRVDERVSSFWLTGRFDLALLLGLAVGSWMGYLAGKPESAIRHVAGRQLWKGKEATKILRSIARKECAVSGEGLSLHPDFQWRLAYDRESRHFLIIGSTGGGKTVIIIPLVKAAIARGDKLVIYDNKGDFTRWLPHGVLFAPWDSRSWAWDIGRDCRNKQDAIELASRLIPEGQDPLWHTAARQILVAILLRLQRDLPGRWGWKELYQHACQSREALLTIIESELPEARHVVAAPEKTSQSILVNFGAHLSLLADLAAAWGDMPISRRFSFRDWLDDPSAKQRVLVLQGSGKYAQLARSYIQSAVAMMAGHINAPAFAESTTRKLWFILDEFPQLGALPEVAPLLEIGRSKGVRVVLGAQDMAQLKELYGEHVAASWASMIGTTLMVRVNASETANFLSKEVIGYRTIDRTGIHKGELQAPVRENVLVVEPAELESELGPNKEGAKALVLGFGDAFILQWPFTKTEKRRAPSKPAAWLQHSVSDKPPSYAATAETGITQTASTSVAPEPEIHSPKPRLHLRAPADELRAMAITGTAMEDAADPVNELQSGVMAGDAA